MKENIGQKIILELIRADKFSPEFLDAIRRKVLKTSLDKSEYLRKSDLLKSYHELLKSGKITKSVQLEKVLTKRGVRTLSGVAVITVLTKPWSCPGKCIYCPDEARMPKSYLSDEPAAARALRLEFDPYEQVIKRLEVLEQNGHPTDKIELIVKGGSWNAYPLDYEYWFILRCFEAANKQNQTKQIKKVELLRKNLLLAQKKNESAKQRIIGLTLETRPDMITPPNLMVMRELGCTRLELGVQSTNDKILNLIKRGHDTKTIKVATKLAKNYGFKVDYHLMPQLPQATPAKDLKMMLEVFENPDYRPDMIKIYPCTVIAGTELYDWLKRGEYKTYSDKQLVEMLIKFKTQIPRYCRVSRLIRDIPSNHIKAGNMMTNLRQVIQNEMKKRGLKCNCLRCREAGHQTFTNPLSTKGKTDGAVAINKIKMFIDKYEASDGVEYFLSFEDSKRTTVYAFCRLRVTKDKNSFYPAFIRELHTYGQLTQISTKGEVQHTGLGKQLVAQAEKITNKTKIKKLAVISGVGVRGYYRKLGFKLENGYMVKTL